MSGVCCVERSDLARLPLRGLVALAVRNARRRQPLLTLWAQAAGDTRWLLPVERAILVAEAFAQGDSRLAAAAFRTFEDPASDDGVARGLEAATEVLFSYADPQPEGALGAVFEARSAYDAAARAYGYWMTKNPVDLEWVLEYVDSPRQTVATVADYQMLLTLALGNPPDLGHPVDPSEAGPLGKLWDADVSPEFFTAVTRTRQLLSGLPVVQPPLEPQFSKS